MSAFLATRSALIVLTVVIALGLGCKPQSAFDETQGDPFEQMVVIQQCYFDYAIKNKKAPSSKEDLAARFQSSGYEPSILLKSPRDGQPFVILWGVMPDLTSTPPVVLGYESSSVGDARMVMTTMGVVTMLEDAFQKATFPEGHAAPNNLPTSN